MQRCPRAAPPACAAPVRRCRSGAAPRVASARRRTVPAASAADAVLAMPTEALARTAQAFSGAADAKARLKMLVELAQGAEHLPESARTDENRVLGCTAQVWVTAELDDAGRVQFRGDSDSELQRGIATVVCQGLSGLTPEEAAAVDPSFVGALGLGESVLTKSRTNGTLNMVESLRKRALALSRGAPPPTFPSLLVTATSLEPQGSFAESQAQFLDPNSAQVDRLASLLAEKKIGVVAHFYMDPQVQGVLTSARDQWPHIHISDSLVMADTAVAMAEAGCESVVVLGVDFMSENVQAILEDAGYADVPVYRMASEDIGCSLAEAAEAPAYGRYLQGAAEVDGPSVHVVYINTSLKTKALADAQVPTITCTSSNVVQTVLQAFAQVPGAHVWYGPDTYMGRNVRQLFESLAEMPDEAVQELHPAHTAASVRALLPRFHHFDEGTCVVHHMFGGDVCRTVREGYGDAYLTAHFEVPGEMFTLAMEARTRGMGVVGSTSNILAFIADKVDEAIARGFPERLRVVLGTETGMLTSIVRKVQAALRKEGNPGVEVEIVFPVSQDALTTEQTGGGALPGGLTMVPGPASGEGCSSEGGCASCPYMKMNDLAALMSVCERIGTPGEALLEAHKPRPYLEKVGGKTMAQAGCVPILHMRHFSRNKTLSDELVADMQARAGPR
ncbi:unnamed protein product [Pedinophyceae sp. YPF-701]|nr:unnamed protein product [Pedinophyceae sp. YPF-701]